jgi:hypothetical protein
MKAKIKFRVRPMLLAGLACWVCLMSQAAAAKSPVSKQLRHLRPGTAIQVCTTDGRTLQGELISISGAALELLEQDQQDAVTVESADVVSVSRIGKSRNKFVEAVMVGCFLATAGILIASAGTIY